MYVSTESFGSINNTSGFENIEKSLKLNVDQSIST